jgi:hypothetical protein
VMPSDAPGRESPESGSGETPAVAVAPEADEGILAAIRDAGGRVVDPTEADAVVWTSPGDPEGLTRLLTGSPARWVQLPFAGIESFVAAGAIDQERTFTCAKGAYARFGFAPRLCPSPGRTHPSDLLAARGKPRAS